MPVISLGANSFLEAVIILTLCSLCCEEVAFDPSGIVVKQ